MSNQTKPDVRVNKAAIQAHKRLNALSLDTATQTDINKHLYDIAFQSIAFIAEHIRSVYAASEGLHVIPASLNLREPIKAKAAAYLIRHNIALNKQLHDLYQLDDYIHEADRD